MTKTGLPRPVCNLTAYMGMSARTGGTEKQQRLDSAANRIRQLYFIALPSTPCKTFRFEGCSIRVFPLK